MATRFPTEAANADFIGKDCDDQHTPGERVPSTSGADSTRQRPHGTSRGRSEPRAKDAPGGRDVTKDEDRR
jgi:hypothetical protein